MESSDTLLGFETTGPSSLRPVGGETGDGYTLRVGVRSLGGGVVVVAPIFGGGVWCLICG
jgi:hypothetical protein